MNRKHKTDTMLRILLMPLINESFTSKDILFDLAKAYAAVTNKRLNYKTSKDNYVKARKNLSGHYVKNLRIHNIDDVELTTEIFHPIAEIANCLNDKSANANKYYLELVRKITSSFVTLRDGVISIKYWDDSKDDIFKSHSVFNKIELWNNLIRIATPDIFIASYYAYENIDMKYMYNIPDNIFLSDKLLNPILHKGIAETHMHFKAGISYQYCWGIAMNFSSTSIDISNEGQTNKLASISVYRYFFAKYLNFIESKTVDKLLIEPSFLEYVSCLYKHKKLNGQRYGTLDEKLTRIIQSTMLTENEEEEKENNNNNLKLSEEEIVYLLKDYSLDKSSENIFVNDILSKEIYANFSYLNTSYEIIFLYKALKYFYKNSNSNNQDFELDLFFNYIRVKNTYFEDKVQSNKINGLNYFQTFYEKATESAYKGNNSMYEKHYNLKYKDICLSIFKEQCKNKNLRKLEIKISPKISTVYSANRLVLNDIKVKIKKQIFPIIEQYKIWCETIKNNQKNDSVAKLGIVYHFIKEMSPDNFSGRYCWVSLEHNNISEANNYQLMQLKYINFTKALNILFKEIPILSEYIVGIDAASTENDTEPWVFAPVFRNARKRETTIPYNLDSKKSQQNLGITFHVGEDFRHLISGLRHVHEVIEHFDYRSGDRLGHAIALGVDVERWVNTNEVVCLPIMEHLENLLWIWGTIKANELSCKCENIESEIMKLAEEIYLGIGSIVDLSPYVLWKAYIEKFEGLSPSKIIEIRKEWEKSSDICKKKYCQNYSSNRSWSVNKLLCTHYCPCFFERYRKPIFVKVEKSEIALILEIQKILIKKVEEVGIYVETNPTSNVAIGDIDSIHTHPLLYLNSNGLNKGNSSNSVMITINSDDPIVFSTNVENEISLVYHTLINSGYSRENVLNWIDKVRENGINSSFIKDDKSIDEIIEDMKLILKKCKT